MKIKDLYLGRNLCILKMNKQDISNNNNKDLFSCFKV